MAVEKMRFVNIAGRISDMDNFIIHMIVPFDIQLENAMSIFDSVKGIYSFSEPNPYEELNRDVTELLNVLDRDMSYDPTKSCALMPVELLEPEVESYERQLETVQKISRSLKADLAHKKEIRKQLVPIQNLEVEVSKMFTFTYMKFRFGKMPKESFQKISSYIETLDTIAYQLSEENDFVYLVYFTPGSQQGNIDSLFSSLFFERIRLSGEIKGIPRVALKKIDDEIEELENRITMLDNDSKGFIERNFDRLQELYNFTIQLNEVFDIRRYAVRSHDAFYMIGWIPNSQVDEFNKMVEGFKSITCIIEDDKDVKKSSPPTKLLNNKFFKPFEELVEMYGIPSYNELDPTPFLAITYMLFFGLMFGDVGQGIVIASIGYYLFKKFDNNYGKLAIYLGTMSMISGFLYGSFFGNEEIIGELLPFIPSINPMDYKIPILIGTVGLGAILLIFAMILNIINSFKQQRIGKMLFDRNGIAGLVLYLSLAYVVLTNVSGGFVPLYLIILLIVGPLIIILFAQPLTNWLEKKKEIFPKEGGFFIEAIFELIEAIIAIASNTVSFIRVGAFALNHVGFFLAFHALSDIVGGVGSIAVMIFGNLLIIVLEGLIVSIQGLRLQYYELFSRFFEGEGIEFKPFKIKG